MKITTYLTDCKRKVAEQSPLLNNIGSEGKAYLRFRLRDKNLDLKVRTDIKKYKNGLTSVNIIEKYCCPLKLYGSHTHA